MRKSSILLYLEQRAEMSDKEREIILTGLEWESRSIFSISADTDISMININGGGHVQPLTN